MSFTNSQTEANFLRTETDQRPALYLLKNNKGMFAAVSNYGGNLASVLVPDTNGKLIEVIAGHEETLTRVKPDFHENEIDDKTYFDYAYNRLKKIFVNENGFKEEFWSLVQVNNSAIEVSCNSVHPAGDSQTNLHIRKLYALTGDNMLKISCEITSDGLGTFGLTNTTFFNLNGSGSILNHIVQINADHYIRINESSAAACDVEKVGGTPFDFRKATAIGARINDNNDQLKIAKGYNHLFALNKHSSRTPVARIRGDKSGIIMEVRTEANGLQFYSGNALHDKGSDNSIAFAVAATSSARQHSLALFYSEQSYKSVTVYRFSNQ